MRVKSFDMATGEAAALSGSGKAAVIPVRDVVKTGEDIPSVIFPDSGGNIHSFTAITDCAVLDVLSPPYSSDHGEMEVEKPPCSTVATCQLERDD